MQRGERIRRRQLDKHSLTVCWCQCKKAESAKTYSHTQSSPSNHAAGHRNRTMRQKIRKQQWREETQTTLLNTCLMAHVLILGLKRCHEAFQRHPSALESSELHSDASECQLISREIRGSAKRSLASVPSAAHLTARMTALRGADRSSTVTSQWQPLSSKESSAAMPVSTETAATGQRVSSHAKPCSVLAAITQRVSVVWPLR